MKVEFILETKAFSVNAYYYRDRRHKTAEARLWEIAVLSQLAEIKDLVDLADSHRIKGGAFSVELEFVYPYNLFYTKEQAISGRCFDLSNVEKPLIDLIFGETMDVNDKFITELISTKRAGAIHEIHVKIQLLS